MVLNNYWIIMNRDLEKIKTKKIGQIQHKHNVDQCSIFLGYWDHPIIAIKKNKKLKMNKFRAIVNKLQINNPKLLS